MDYPILVRFGAPLAAALSLSGCSDDTTPGPAGATETDGTDDTAGTDGTTAGGDDTATGDGADSTGEVDDTGTDTGTEDEICLLLNCDEAFHCAGCDDGRTVCDVDENACVACDPTTGVGNCTDDQECTEFGYCVPIGQECPTRDGTPTVDCAADQDCGACDSRHQVCDDGACVACDADDEQWCQSTQHCEQGECIDDCPVSCSNDAECGQCETGGGIESHACFAHRCAQCNDDVPCPSGELCNDQGQCAVPCGIPGQVAGTCTESADCAGCPSGSDTCNAPVSGGHGTCGATAAGCSDLGQGVIVLPDPYGEVTDLCSDDDDCGRVGVDYNVGELLRDITGVDAIDDAIISYPMAACAEASVDAGDGHTIACGVCVPCRQDNDCADIDVDQVANEAFGPLGALATALLLDGLFGPNDHTIDMYCNPLTAEYGVCQPCPAIGLDCTAEPPAPDDPPVADCSHDVCAEGGPLTPACGTCAASVCQFDAFCCSTEWDALCIGHVQDQCAGSCDGDVGGDCMHDQCETGDALSPFCNACTSTVCDADPFCCQTEWDHACVGQVATLCGGDCDDDGCIHSECDLGGPLVSGCSACATAVCDDDAFCCGADWDVMCVDSAIELCDDVCHAGGCAHDVCASGAPLEADCSVCVTDVCAADESCCTDLWDQRCIDLADNECNVDCDGSTPPPQGCAHDACVAGPLLQDDCSSCVTDVCAADSFCCEAGWDEACVQTADALCGCFAACEHAECATGAALAPGCSTCVDTVCETDDSCCSSSWTSTCTDLADSLCGGCLNDCEHDLCEQGAALDPGCDPCVEEVCDADNFCCGSDWDGICVGLADDLCNCGAPPCVHDACVEGEILADGCDDCVALVCFDDDFCCETAWDSTCVDEAADLCGCDTCEHDVCETGDPLTDDCSPCVTDVCAEDAFCCTVGWDSTCVGEAESTCGAIC